MQVQIKIPNNIAFADLKLSRSASGISFDWQLIEAICQACGLDIDRLKNSDEGNVTDLILSWYIQHRQVGGLVDPVMEDVFAEVLAEISAGSQSFPAPNKIM